MLRKLEWVVSCFPTKQPPPLLWRVPFPQKYKRPWLVLTTPRAPSPKVISNWRALSFTRTSLPTKSIVESKPSAPAATTLRLLVGSGKDQSLPRAQQPTFCANLVCTRENIVMSISFVMWLESATTWPTTRLACFIYQTHSFSHISTVTTPSNFRGSFASRHQSSFRG